MARVVDPKQLDYGVASKVRLKESKASHPSPSTADIGANGTSGYGTASALELEVSNALYARNAMQRIVSKCRSNTAAAFLSCLHIHALIGFYLQCLLPARIGAIYM